MDDRKKMGTGVVPTTNPVQAPDTEKESPKKGEATPVGPMIEPIVEGEFPEIEAD